MGTLGKRQGDLIRVQVIRECYFETPPSVRLGHVSCAVFNPKVFPLRRRRALRAIDYFPDKTVGNQSAQLQGRAGILQSTVKPVQTQQRVHFALLLHQDFVLCLVVALFYATQYTTQVHGLRVGLGLEVVVLWRQFILY